MIISNIAFNCLFGCNKPKMIQAYEEHELATMVKLQEAIVADASTLHTDLYMLFCTYEDDIMAWSLRYDTKHLALYHTLRAANMKEINECLWYLDLPYLRDETGMHM